MAPSRSLRKPTQFLLLLSAIFFLSCTPEDPALVSSPRQHTSFNHLTGEELSAFPDVYVAVKTLRGAWLTGRGDPPRKPRIYLDGILVADIGGLSSIATHEVRELRYLSSYEATNRYGAGSLGGVIEIVTRR